MWHRLQALSVACALACSDPTEPQTPATPAGTEDVQAACKALCAASSRCGFDLGSSCAESCSANYAHPENYQKRYFDLLVDCYEADACANTSCVRETILGLHPGIDDDRGVHECSQRVEVCEAEGETFSPSACTFIVLLVPPAREKLHGCMAKSCSEVASCFREVF